MALQRAGYSLWVSWLRLAVWLQKVFWDEHEYVTVIETDLGELGALVRDRQKGTNVAVLQPTVF